MTSSGYPCDSGALAKLTFGDGKTDWIKPSDTQGRSHEIGDVVEYQNRQLRIAKKYSNGDIKLALPAMLEVSMTAADLSGLKMGASEAIIAAAFIPKW